MGRDGLQFGIRVRKFMLFSTRIVYRLVCNHPFFVGIFLFLLFLYRSSPFLFSLLVSASPVLVCTAVLLGTLLSLGEPNFPLIEEDEKISTENVASKTGRFENVTVVEKHEGLSRDWCSELTREVVERSADEEPLLESTDRASKVETNVDGEGCIEFENLEIEQKVNSDDQKTLVGVEVGSSHDDGLENRSTGKIQSENSEDYISAEGSDDAQISDRLDFSTGSWKQFDEVLESNRFSPVHKIQAVVHAQIRNQLESSLRSWKQLDGVENKPSPSHVVRTDNFNNNTPAEGLLESEIRDRLESSLGSWKQLDSDGDDDSDSGSDGAESSSPDASLADIIPMLDELHPLLEEENLHTSNLSCENSASMLGRSGKSHESSIHSDGESDQKEDKDAKNFESDGGDDDNDDDDVDDGEEEETQGTKGKDHVESPITWTEDDQKNFMDLGSSELERNQRLESLIARRRARRNFGVMAERNLIDLDGMDLQFQVSPISTTRRNPFDFPHDSYDDLGLPPIPGSAPSIMASRGNPFDLPYDSSEEKPDLMGDSFQQEFMELNQKETSSQREAVFRRNETFSIGSSFDFTRQEGKRSSRFKPYFVPERADSDVMSYSSLQRQYSELSESKLSSAAETESVSGYEDEHTNKSFEHQSSDIDHISLYVEHGSHSSEDVHSLSDKENEHEADGLHGPGIELGRAENSFTATFHASEIGLMDGFGSDVEGNYVIAESRMSDSEISIRDIQLKKDSVEEDDTTNVSLSASRKDHNDSMIEDVDDGLVSREQRQTNNVENAVYGVSENVAELDNIHRKEPVYDSSPRVVQKNHSSSSIQSDKSMEISDNDSNHLTTMQRDLFVSEECKDCEGDAEEYALDRKQDADDNCLSVKQSVECDKHSINELQFSEDDQSPLKLEASLMPESAFHLNMYSSDMGLVKDELLDDNISSHKEQVLGTEDIAAVNMDAKQDGVMEKDDMSTASEFKPSESITSATEKSEISTMADSVFSVQSKLSHAGVELREDDTLQKKADQEIHASSSDLENNDTAVEKSLDSSFDGAHYFPYDSVIHDILDESAKQEPAVICREPEEVAKIKDVDVTVDVVPVQESQENVFFEFHPSDNLSSQPHDSEDTPFINLANRDNIGYDEKMSFDTISDTKEMDDDLLSELDAVGDFSMKDSGPIFNLSQIYSNAEVDSNIAQQELGEVHSNPGLPFSHDTLLENNTFVEHFGTMENISESKNARFEEPSLDSQTRDVDADSLVLEAQSVKDTEAAAFKKVSEGAAQESSIAESLLTELARDQVESPYQETELIQDDAERGNHAIEVTLEDGATAATSELFTKSTAPHVDSVEVMSEISTMDKEIPEQAGEDFGIVESEMKMFNAVESLSAAETLADSGDCAPVEFSPSDESTLPASKFSTQVEGVDSVDFKSLRTDKGIEELPIVQPITDLVVESENIGFLESETLDMHREVKEIQESPVFEVAQALESETPTGRVDYVDSESLPVDKHTKEILNLPVVEANIAPSVDSNDDGERAGYLESESLLIDSDNKEVQESPVETIAASVDFADQTERVESMDSQSVDRSIGKIQELHIVEASTAEKTEEVSRVESGTSLINDMNIEEKQEPVVADVGIMPTVESEDQIERSRTMESELLQTNSEIKEQQEPLTVEASIASMETEPVNTGTSRTQESPVVEGSSTAHKTEEFHEEESGSSLTDKNIEERNESSVAKASVLPQVESEDKQEPAVVREIIASMDSHSLNRSIDRTQEFPMVEESIAQQTDEGVHVESGSSLNGQNIEERQEESHVADTTVLPTGEFESQIERVGCLGSDLLQTKSEINVQQEPPVVKESIASMDNESVNKSTDSKEVAVVKPNITPQIEEVCNVESELSLTDKNIEERRESLVAEATDKKSSDQGFSTTAIEKSSLQGNESGSNESRSELH